MSMGKESYKESVRLALLHASERYKMTRISKECNVPAGSIRTFKLKGELGGDFLHQLATWLTTHGYLEGVPVQPDHPPNEDQAIEAMCKDLEALVAVLRSPIDKAAKARAFGERITFWNESMKEYLRQVKERKDT